MVPAVVVPGDSASASYDDDYYATSYGYEPLEYSYSYGKKDYGKTSYASNSFNRKSGEPNNDQVSSSYTYFGWHPHSGGSYSGGQYGSRSDSYGSYDGYGGGHKCCCNNNNNNLATLGALALGFLALNGQLQNIINAINAGGGRRRKRGTDSDETANGKMTARLCFAKSPLAV